MTDTAQSAALVALLESIEARFGLATSPSQLPLVTQKLHRLINERGLGSFVGALAQTRSDANLLPKLVAGLTIGETYFLRNRAHFAALRHCILPELSARLGSAGCLTVWSAGCATGEEPYSLAMWVREYAPELWPNRLQIVATDLSPDALATAHQGVFTSWSMRRVETQWLQRYFTRAGEDYVVDPALRSVIRFEQHNLASGLLPSSLRTGGVHLVVCRNVFIYFASRAMDGALKLFERALDARGALLLGHAESLPMLRRWRSQFAQGTFFYRPPRPLTDRAARPPSRRRPAAARSQTQARRRPLPHRVRGPLEQPAHGVRATVADLAEARRAADQEDYPRAQKILGEYLADHKTDVQAYHLCALVEEQLGDFAAAKIALKKLLFLDKNLAVGHYLMALLAEREDDGAGAARRYRTVLRLLEGADDDTTLPLASDITAGRLRELAWARCAEIAPEQRGRNG